jgi:hypothetical protein
MRSAGMSNETVTQLVFRISPITTFERQFSQGLAGLECGNYRFLMTNFKRGFGNLVRATLGADAILRRNTPLEAGNRKHSELILGAFRSEYSVNEGVTRFKALFTEVCDHFILESFDHVTWRVTESDANTTCVYSRDGTPYNTRPGRVTFSSSCQPVYYQTRPIVL